MPCRGLIDNVDDYVDCLDQLYEIAEKYRSSHIVILGGDMNEDLVLRGQTTRGNYLEKFLAEAEMDTKSTTKTFVNPDGFASTLDYVFYLKKFSGIIVEIRTLENLLTNVSDHVPVLCKIEFSVDRVRKDRKQQNLNQPRKIQWTKVDHDLYRTKLAKSLCSIDTDVDNIGTLDTPIIKLNEALDTCARASAPRGDKKDW